MDPDPALTKKPGFGSAVKLMRTRNTGVAWYLTHKKLNSTFDSISRVNNVCILRLCIAYISEQIRLSILSERKFQLFI